MRLLQAASNTVLVEHLESADGLWPRMKGLLGRRNLPEGRGLWIPRCNSVHTFFMNFPIDLIFVDRAFVVRKIMTSVAPGRIVWPVWTATDVIEVSAGLLEKHPVRIGEQLHVDHTVS